MIAKVALLLAALATVDATVLAPGLLNAGILAPGAISTGQVVVIPGAISTINAPGIIAGAPLLSSGIIGSPVLANSLLANGIIGSPLGLKSGIIAPGLILKK